MAYKIIETITKRDRKRVQFRSTGHNGITAEQKKIARAKAIKKDTK